MSETGNQGDILQQIKAKREMINRANQSSSFIADQSTALTISKTLKQIDILKRAHQGSFLPSILAHQQGIL
jgi:hypothetical protein